MADDERRRRIEQRALERLTGRGTSARSRRARGVRVVVGDVEMEDPPEAVEKQPSRDFGDPTGNEDTYRRRR